MVDEDDLTGLAGLLDAEWDAISGAPTFFIASVLIIGLVIVGLVRWHYAGRIDTLKGRVDLKEDQRAFFEKRLEIERQKEPLPGGGSISRDPDVVKTFNDSQSHSLSSSVNPLSGPEQWGKTLSTNELNQAVAIRFLVDEGLLELNQADSGEYIATATSTATDPGTVRRVRSFEDPQDDEDEGQTNE